MLKDEVYALDNELIKDELISLFVAGSGAGSAAISNLIWYMAIEDQCRVKLLDEINSIFPTKESINSLEYDSLEDMNYLKMSMNESLRIEPGDTNSMINTFTEDVKIGPYNIKKNDIVYTGIYQAGHNPQ